MTQSTLFHRNQSEKHIVFGFLVNVQQIECWIWIDNLDINEAEWSWAANEAVSSQLEFHTGDWRSTWLIEPKIFLISFYYSIVV